MGNVKICLLLLMIISSLGCEKQSMEEEQIPGNLEFTQENLSGSWMKTRIYMSSSKNSLDENEPQENLMDKYEECRKDDIYNYVISTDSDDNLFYWGYNKDLCEGQKESGLIKVASWTLDTSGQLGYFYADVMEPYQIIILTQNKLLIRKASGIIENASIKYHFEEYRRLQ